MTVHLNRSIIAGRLTRDPECKAVNQTHVTIFSVALNRRYKTSDGTQKDDTTFIDCEAWGNLAERVQQFGRKGAQLIVSGRLKHDTWTDKDGNTRSRVRIACAQVQFIDFPDPNDKPADARVHEGAFAYQAVASADDGIPPF